MMGSNPIEADTTSTQTFGPLDNRDVQLAGMSPQDRAAVAALPPGTALLLADQIGRASCRARV